MKLSHCIKLTLVLLAVAALLFSAAPVQAKPQPPPPPETTDDADQDGLLDEEEGVLRLPNAETSVTTYPTIPDVFCSFPTSDLSWIPPFSLDILTQPAGSGLDVNVHYVLSSDYGVDRAVVLENSVPRHRGVKMIESLNTSVTFLGWCGNGTPNTEGAGECTIYTRRMEEWIIERCGNRYGTDNCVGYMGGDESTSVTGPDLLDELITWSVVHEFLHSNNCREDYYRKNGGNHFAEGTLFIMDSVAHSYESDGVVYFEIPNVVSTECFNDRLLY